MVSSRNWSQENGCRLAALAGLGGYEYCCYIVHFSIDYVWFWCLPRLVVAGEFAVGSLIYDIVVCGFSCFDFGLDSVAWKRVGGGGGQVVFLGDAKIINCIGFADVSIVFNLLGLGGGLFCFYTDCLDLLVFVVGSSIWQ